MNRLRPSILITAFVFLLGVTWIVSGPAVAHPELDCTIWYNEEEEYECAGRCYKPGKECILEYELISEDPLVEIWSCNCRYIASGGS